MTDAGKDYQSLLLEKCTRALLESVHEVLSYRVYKMLIREERERFGPDEKVVELSVANHARAPGDEEDSLM